MTIKKIKVWVSFPPSINANNCEAVDTSCLLTPFTLTSGGMFEVVAAFAPPPQFVFGQTFGEIRYPPHPLDEGRHIALSLFGS